MKKITVPGSYAVYTNVTVDPLQAFEAIRRSAGFADTAVIKGKLYRREDISQHGSCCFKDTLVSDSPKMCEVAEAFTLVWNYLRDPSRYDGTKTK